MGDIGKQWETVVTHGRLMQAADPMQAVLEDAGSTHSAGSTGRCRQHTQCKQHTQCRQPSEKPHPPSPELLLTPTSPHHSPPQPCHPHSQQVPRATRATNSSSMAASRPTGTQRRRDQCPARHTSSHESPTLLGGSGAPMSPSLSPSLSPYPPVPIVPPLSPRCPPGAPIPADLPPGVPPPMDGVGLQS